MTGRSPAPPVARTALVTGATSGIGRATAAALAERGDRVLLVARDAARGADALREIGARAAAAGRGGSAELLFADLSHQDQVRRLADDVRARAPRLDVLVNNAGALFDTRQLTADGIEATLAVNHVAYFQLTTLLLDPLRAAATAVDGAPGEARVVVVASEAHRAIRSLPLDDLQLTRGWSSMRAYALSKLANVMFAYALARRTAGTGVAVNALHPGVIASRFAAGTGGIFGTLFGLARPFMANPAKGARTSVYLASDPSIAGATGGYYQRQRASRSSGPSYDVAAQEALWTATEGLLRG